MSMEAAKDKSCLLFCTHLLSWTKSSFVTPRPKSRLSPRPRTNAKFPQFFPLSQIHLIVAPPTLTRSPKPVLALRHYNRNYNECNNLNTVSSELGLSKRYPGDDVYISNLHWVPPETKIKQLPTHNDIIQNEAL